MRRRIATLVMISAVALGLGSAGATRQLADNTGPTMPPPGGGTTASSLLS